MSLWGLDPVQCRELAKALNRSAQQLEQAGAHVSGAIARTRWQGPDSQRFRAQWSANRQQLFHTARDLESAATALLREIAEQERASAVDGGGGNGGGGNGGNLWDSIVDAGAELWEDFSDGVDTAVDSLRDGLDWLADGIKALPQVGAAQNFLEQLEHLGGMGLDMLAGNPPSLSALVAQVVLAGGTGINSAITSATHGLVDLRLFEDGEPYAGEPVAVTQGSANALQQPTSASDIFASVEDAYAMAGEPGMEDGAIRIVKVEQPDGSFAYIVNIPGTEQWLPNGSGQGRDLTSNLMLVAGQSTSAQQAVVLAMAQAGIPADAPVMLAGHSQGGMLAAQLGSDPEFLAQFNVTNIMSVGSPIDTSSISPHINVLAAQHEGDVVPMLDLGGLTTGLQMPGSAPNVTVVTMGNPPRDALGNALHHAPLPLANAAQAVRDVMANHATEDYREDLADTDRYPEVREYEQDPSMAVFLSSDPERVSGVDVPVGRN